MPYLLALSVPEFFGGVFRGFFYYQGFIQALLLTFVFHEELSFMAIGHNLKCISILILAAGGSRVAPLVAISVISSFQIAFPCIFGRHNFFLFRDSFLYLYGLFTLFMTPKVEKK